MAGIPSLQMNDGRSVPVLGLGTSVELNYETGFNPKQLEQLIEVVVDAIKVGYRHIDSAHIYRSEKPIGDAVKKAVSEGLVKREELFITTKLWNHKHAPEDVEPALRESLKKLSMDYVDLFLMHWPMSYSADGKVLHIDILDTWKAMERVKDLGLAKSIGVSNFNINQLTRLLSNCRIRPAVNQIEVNLNLQVPELVKFCQDQKIVVIGYTPFGKIIGSRSQKNPKITTVDHPLLVDFCKKYNKSVGQIMLRFLIQRGIVVIPKTVTKTRLIENMSIFDFKFTEAEMKALYALNTGYRTINEPYWWDHPEYPFEEPKDEEKISIPTDLLS